IGGAIACFAHRRWRRAFGITATIVAGLLGLAGCFGLWTWLCTQHWAVYRNENLFGYSPIALLLAFALPRALRKKTRRAVFVARWSAIFIGFTCVLGIILKPVLPAQVNGEALAL